MVTTRKSYGYVCSQEEIKAVHKHPTPEQQLVIDEYREKFEACMGRIPEGLHYLRGLGPVWLPLEERGVERQVEGIPLPEEPVRNVG